MRSHFLVVAVTTTIKNHFATICQAWTWLLLYTIYALFASAIHCLVVEWERKASEQTGLADKESAEEIQGRQLERKIQEERARERMGERNR